MGYRLIVQIFLIAVFILDITWCLSPGNNLPSGYQAYLNILYGDSSQQVLDIYTTGQKAPTLVYFHGGGWIQGSKDDNYILDQVFIPYFDKHWNIVNVEYRLGGNTAPHAPLDALLAINWIKDNGLDFKLDIGNLITMGHSAGGHLALFAGFSTHGRQGVNIGGIINYLGITNIAMLEKYLAKKEDPELNYPLYWIGSKKLVADISNRYSPVFLVTKNSPPVISIHGEKDEVVPYAQAVDLHRILKRSGIKNLLLPLDTDLHQIFGPELQKMIDPKIFNFFSN